MYHNYILNLYNTPNFFSKGNGIRWPLCSLAAYTLITHIKRLSSRFIMVPCLALSGIQSTDHHVRGHLLEFDAHKGSKPPLPSPKLY